jgi:maleylpyruvate isomerase
MKLYEGWRSSASWRVRWALALKKLPYESVWLDVAAGEHMRVLPNLNPLCTVPTLELPGGDVLTESVAIIEWLDETRPDPPLLPGDPRARARVRQLVQLVNADIHPLQNTSVRRAIAADERAQNAWCAHWIERGLSAYEALVRAQTGRFSLGDSLTMADLFLIPQIESAERFGAEIRPCKRIRSIYDACLATPEAQATHPRSAEARAMAARRMESAPSES